MVAGGSATLRDILLFALPALLLALVVAAPAHAGTTPPTPGPFYTAPREIPATPGTVIRTQRLRTGVPAGAVGWRVLYASRSFQGNRRIVTSGVVFAPVGRPRRATRRVVAWAHPTVGVARGCAPSIAADGGASVLPGLQQFLRAGYVVAATDYPGLGTAGVHPYLVGVSQARAVLDAVRAARRIRDAGAGSRFAVWGHSQGGHAALFAAQLARSYAPELRLVGTAAAAPAAELARLLSLDANTIAGQILAAYALFSWANVYDVPRGIRSLVAPAGVPRVLTIARQCISLTAFPPSMVTAAEQLLAGGLVHFRDVPTTPPWPALLRANTPTGRGIASPLLVTQGTADTIVIPSTTAALVRVLCRRGLRLQYRTLAGVSHTDAGFDSVPVVVPWIRARFNGARAPSTCGAPTSAAR